MRRREFIAALGSAAAWPLVARAQQSSLPVVGYITVGYPDGFPVLALGTGNNRPSWNSAGRRLTSALR